jgi:hypothetical protein
MREQIDAAIRAEVLPLRGKQEVLAYLDRLRARALAQRKVTALEVEPGLAALERLEPVIGNHAVQQEVIKFAQSMAQLSHSFPAVAENRK